MITPHEFKELVKSARTVRRYAQAEVIPREVLTDIVDCVRFVPSGSNQQPLKYRSVSERAECAAVFVHLKWAATLKDWGGPVEGERPAAYIVIVADKDKSPAIDVGIAAQTMNLCARAQGIAMCMLGAINREGIHAALRLPEDLRVQLVLALGRPVERVVLEELPPGGATAYWRTPDGVHHVPKRALRDVLTSIV